MVTVRLIPGISQPGILDRITSKIPEPKKTELRTEFANRNKPKSTPAPNKSNTSRTARGVSSSSSGLGVPQVSRPKARKAKFLGESF